MEVEKDHKYDFDLVVIGGGSGGLAAAKEAVRLRPNLKVAVFDFVNPSPHGTSWGLGGTCVNVGCIPKKLFHYTASMSSTFDDAKSLGWRINANERKHHWPTLIEAVTNYIKSLNFSYRTSLRAAKIQYINALAAFVDPHTVEYTLKGAKKLATAAHFIVAVGGRPHYPDIPGAHLAISSDDIFWRETPPGKTLVVGGSYIALECASFLHGLGYDTHVMVRSILLRGFDSQAASQVGEIMERRGIRFINPAVPTKLHRNDPNGPITVTYETSDHKSTSEEFDTVLFAIGRDPQTPLLHLDKAGVKTDQSGKVVVDEYERSSVPHIYAIGDVIAGPVGFPGRPELTPVAIKTGQLLVRRLFAGADVKMDYHLIPTTVFTEPEYGTIGLSQESAEAQYGKENISVYVSRYSVLEHGTTHLDPVKPRSHAWIDDNLWLRQRTLASGKPWEDFKADSYEYEDFAGQYNHNTSLAKVVCDKKDNEKVIGFHYVGPNAGEVTQGFALAMRFGATKAGLDQMVGIHPTSAEEFGVIATTLESGDSFMKKEGCGGGGTCG